MFGRKKKEREPKPWSRSKLIAVLAGGSLFALLCVGTAGYGLYSSFFGSPDSTPTVSAVEAGATSVLAADPTKRREQIAQAPMFNTTIDEGLNPDPALEPFGTITIPSSTLVFQGGVPSGFPQTPEGAVGQLAAITQSVLDSADVTYARSVYDEWVLPGGPEFADWELTQNIKSFLNKAKSDGTEYEGTAAISVVPKAAMVKGTDGDDWATVCALFKVTIFIDTVGEGGWGYCAAMQWQDGRWQIASVAAEAPHAWPGSTAALEAGWLAIKEG
ncbi:MAG: hypothetical protein LBR20_06520 [Propionibacteriaceae bacterium]|nr:hypothetical protein [Propionibacteriaceae bacterium]